MVFCKRIYVIACVYLCMTSEGFGYFTSSTNETWQTAGTYCKLAQPSYQYNDVGVLELVENIKIDEPIPESGVWIGYFKAFTEFEFKGCGMYSDGNVTLTVYSLVQCHHICGGTHIGLILATNANSYPRPMKCVCIKALANNRVNNICISCGDIICGKERRSESAVYSVLPDTTSDGKIDDIDYVCKVSTSNPNASAWVNCSDTNTSNSRGVWCRKTDSSPPFVSGVSFSAWNTANDYCADNNSFPASAIGYTGSPFDTLRFTNIRREWTLHPGNGSSSKGPKMFAYIIPGSKKIFFSNEATAETKQILCFGPKPTITTPSTSSELSSSSPTTLYHSASTSTQKSETTQEAGTTANGIASGVTVAVALGAALVNVIVLRKKGKLCFAKTKGSKLVNRDDNNHISLAEVESKTNENTFGCTKDIDEYYADIDNDSVNTESKQNGVDQTPGAPVMNHTNGTRMKKERGASNDTSPTYQNTNGKLPESEANAYFVLEKHGIEKMNKQQSAVSIEISVSNTEGHPYFVLEKQSCQSVNEGPSVEAHPYFTLEKQTVGNSASLNSVNERVMGNGDMYQEIHANYEYAGIDDLRGDNNDYDYTNKAFKDSNNDFSDNVYNHLNSDGDEYDHMSKSPNIVMAVENDYADTSGVVRK